MVLLDPYSVFISRGEDYMVYGIVMRSTHGELLKLFTHKDVGRDNWPVGLFPDYFVGDPGIEGRFNSYHSSQELIVPRIYLFKVLILEGEGG